MEEPTLKTFRESFYFKNVVKEPTCSKTLSNTSCTDLTLTNKECFKNSCCNEPRLSDFHKMTVFVIQSVIW